MKAITAFKKTIERADSLLKVHRAKYPKGRPPASSESADILRSAIVFAVAALDSYIHDKIVENIMPIIRHYGKKGHGFPGYLIKILEPKISTEKALVLLHRPRYDYEIVKIVREYNSERTFQDPGKIEKGLQILGIDDLWEPLRKQLKVSSKPKAKKYLTPFIKRRNQIVHEGDLYKSYKYRHRLRVMSRNIAEECIDHVKKFGFAIDTIIDHQLKTKLSK